MIDKKLIDNKLMQETFSFFYMKYKPTVIPHVKRLNLFKLCVLLNYIRKIKMATVKATFINIFKKCCQQDVKTTTSGGSRGCYSM